MTSRLALTRSQQWLFRNRRPVRVGCWVFLLVLLSWTIWSFAEGMVVRGALSVPMVLSPVVLWQSTRTVERLVAQLQVKAD